VGVGEWYSNVCVKVMINPAVGCLSCPRKNCTAYNRISILFSSKIRVKAC
jgi:hypothetical protein